MKPLAISLMIHGCALTVLLSVNALQSKKNLFNTPKPPKKEVTQHIRVDVLALPELRKMLAPRRRKPKPVVKKAIAKAIAIPSRNPKPKVALKPKPKPKPKKNKPKIKPKKKEVVRNLAPENPKSAFVGKTRLDILKELRAGNRLQKGALLKEVSIGVNTPTVPVHDPFWTELKIHISNKWEVFSHFKGQGLSTKVRLVIDEDGLISKFDVLEMSQSEAFDRYVKEFIETTLIVDLSIPERLQAYLMQQGIAVTFEP